MDWTRQVDGYCERLDPSFWAEPINAVTNGAFLVVAVIMWRRSQGLPLARRLCAVLFAIGVGSFLFHTYAQTWAGLADTLPILIFVLLYIFTATKAYWQQSTWRSLGITALFFPYAAALVPLFQMIPDIGGSAAYGPVPLLIALYAYGLRNRFPATAKRLAIGTALVTTSLLIRTVDAPLCTAIPMGTHFMWHLLNAVALGWMIETYRRHMLAPLQKQG
ncbi:MAG: ceramidase domain-containing protein [Cognatishimia sp.]